ncbi:CPBP family intramembrane metalloprotease [Hymenobacter sp. RP-2-7]|uniref:CPBP family intramembrane metalloprotease n=1 Tax=Hymenobacter polaris TaxID=2682546 RepID=A0A7Y0AH92_9BACT|nr:CPBP family intramembrane glutamic endopeptidase [Hymenobacter polaris]NML67157.1 CPBP family intramembrane metalloprotease [Hymenobacter polaris]
MPYSYPLALLGWALLWSSLCLLLTASKLWVAPRPLGRAALVCALHMLVLVLPWSQLLGLPATPTSLGHPPLAWAAKVVALLVSGLVLYGVRWVVPAAAGLRRPGPGTLRPVGLVVGAVAVAVFASAYAARRSFLPLWWPERLYYSVVPGLEEELFYRGALLGLLGPVFARSIPLPGTRTSWGGLATVLLFALGHSLKLSFIYDAVNNLLLSQAHLAGHVTWWQSLLYFVLTDTAYPLLMGLLLLWVRERTGSVWVAVAAHCLLNTALTLGRTLP